MDTNQKNELADIVVRGCGRVWDSIGYDCLQVCEGDSMPADHVVEMCVDADRLTTFGEPDAEAAWELLSEEFDSYADQLKFIASRMPFKTYGY